MLLLLLLLSYTNNIYYYCLVILNGFHKNYYVNAAWNNWSFVKRKKKNYILFPHYSHAKIELYLKLHLIKNLAGERHNFCPIFLPVLSLRLWIIDSEISVRHILYKQQPYRVSHTSSLYPQRVRWRGNKVKTSMAWVTKVPHTRHTSTQSCHMTHRARGHMTAVHTAWGVRHGILAKHTEPPWC